MANKSLFSTKVFVNKTDSFNEAGGSSYKLDDYAALAQLASTGCLNQTFYANAETQLNQVLELANKVPSEYLAKLAVFSREKGYMKDMPALLTAVLATRKDAAFKPTFERVIDNGKMLRNFVQIIRSGVVGRKSFGSLPKRLIQQWFANRKDDEIFRNSIGNDPSMADVLKLVHPKPDSKSKEAMYGWMLGREYNTEVLPNLIKSFEAFKKGESMMVPNVPFEMLTALPLSKEAWKEISRNARWQWTRMNLNTMQRHGVFEDQSMIDLVANRLRNTEDIHKARVFPYQLLAAYLNVGSDIPQKIKNALQDALEIATENVPSIDGKVYVCVDVSGSMSSAITGNRGSATTKMNCVQVASLIASVILRKNDEAEVIPFADRVKQIDLNPKDSIMTNAGKITAMLNGGTNCSAPVAMLNEKGKHGDMIILVSDNQSWMDTWGYHNYNYGYGNVQQQPTRLMAEWTKFKGRNSNAKLVNIDLQPYVTTQTYERKDILNVGGFSDHVFNILSAFAHDQLDAKHWVGEIERIEL